MRPLYQFGWMIFACGLVMALSPARAFAVAEKKPATEEAKSDHATHEPAKDAKSEHGKGGHAEEKPGLFPNQGLIRGSRRERSGNFLRRNAEGL